MYILCQLSPQGLRVNIVFLFLVEYLWIPARVISIDRPDQESVTYPFFSSLSVFSQVVAIVGMLKNEEYNAATQKSKYGNDKSQVNLWLFFWLFVLKRCLFQLRLSKIWNLLGKSKSQTITKIDSSSIFAILLCY